MTACPSGQLELACARMLHSAYWLKGSAAKDMRAARKRTGGAVRMGEAGSAKGVGAGAPALRVDGLAFRYARMDVWSDVSFTIEPGQIAFLTGPNGSGKSTLFRCLAGWSAPTEGDIELFGRPFDGADRAVRRKVAYVPDVPSFYDDLTAAEHVRFMMAANRVPAGDEEAARLLDEFGLARHAGQFPSSYSRGMRLKLALVLALAAKPRLLLLDEPYGPLDREASCRLSALLDAARADGAAVLVSCHHDVPNLEPDLLLHLAEGLMVKTLPGRSAEIGRG